MTLPSKSGSGSGSAPRGAGPASEIRGRGGSVANPGPDFTETDTAPRSAEEGPAPRSADPDPDPAAGDTNDLWAALEEVRDPELPISIVDLGIVYAIRREAGRVEVDLTFTATACPCMGFIQEDVRERLLAEPGVTEVEIRVVWDPPWTRERMTEEGKAILRQYGVAA